MKKLSLLLFCLSCLVAKASDCVPLTYSTISMLANHPIAYETWETELVTKNKSPALADCLASWNKHFMMMPMTCVYSGLNAVKAVEREIKYDNTPYLWVGRVPKQMTDNAPEEEAHSAVAIFQKDYAWIVHTLGVKSSQYYYVEKLSYGEFFSRTYLVYEPISPIKVDWKNLLDIALKHE